MSFFYLVFKHSILFIINQYKQSWISNHRSKPNKQMDNQSGTCILVEDDYACSEVEIKKIIMLCILMYIFMSACMFRIGARR